MNPQNVAIKKCRYNFCTSCHYQFENMANKAQKKSLDLLNLAYGIGAAIVIVGAMFKFLAWPYANQLFLIGLTTEAVIFLISGFEFRKPAPERLRWERVFPQIDPKFRGEYEQIDLSSIHEIYFRNTKAVVESVEGLNGNLSKLTEATEKIAGTVAQLGTNLERIDKATTHYEGELNELSERMKSLNTFYNNMNLASAKMDAAEA